MQSIIRICSEAAVFSLRARCASPDQPGRGWFSLTSPLSCAARPPAPVYFRGRRALLRRDKNSGMMSEAAAPEDTGVIYATATSLQRRTGIPLSLSLPLLPLPSLSRTTPWCSFLSLLPLPGAATRLMLPRPPRASAAQPISITSKCALAR